MSFPASDDDFLLLHNTQCSKCRASKALLEERGIAFSERFYLDEPLSREEIQCLVKRLGKPVSEWVRRREDAFAAAGLTSDSDEEAILDAMVAHPILVERPILVRGQRAIIGRPPEDLLPLL